MTSFGSGDTDLHRSDGSHITTPPTADGHALELYQDRLERHLVGHAADRLDSPNDSPELPRRYRVVYSIDSAGSFTDFSADDDKAAIAHAQASAYGARIVSLAEVEIWASGDKHRPVTLP